MAILARSNMTVPCPEFTQLERVGASASSSGWDDGGGSTRSPLVRYDEPPDWILPVRHALGATLLQSKKPAEAEAVFREDLRRLPDNGWSLFGLGRSLRLQGKEGEAAEVEARFKEIWAGADIELTSSCFCQPGV